MTPTLPAKIFISVVAVQIYFYCNVNRLQAADGTTPNVSAAPATSDATETTSSDAAASVAQPPRSVSYTPEPLDMFTNLPGDFVHWSSAAFVQNNLPVMGAVVATTALGFSTDHSVYSALHTTYQQNLSVQRVNNALVWLGDGRVHLGMGAAFALYGAVFADPRALTTASEIVEGFLATGATVQILKHVTGRESPIVATGTSSGRWSFFPNPIVYQHHIAHYYAFPSGHMATAITTLTVLQQNYPDSPWISWLGIPAIAGLGASLVATGMHWWSDFPLSIVLGYSFGKLIAHPEQFLTIKEAGGTKTTLMPTMFANGAMGMAYAMTW